MVAVSNELKRKLEASASAGKRSLSAEMVLRLERSFESDDDADAMVEKVEHLEDQVSSLWQSIEELQRSVSALYRGS